MIPTRAVVWIMLCVAVMCFTISISNMNIAINSMVGDLEETLSKAGVRGQVVKIEWDKSVQNTVLGSTYWFVWLANLISGWFCHHYGAKICLSLCIFICAITTALIPTLAYVDWLLVALIRSLQGFLTGFITPGVVDMIGKWAPLNERGKFMSVMLALPLATGVSSSVFGYVADHIGWEYIFYITSLIMFSWFFFWILVVTDFPYNHPWITEKEKSYINSKYRSNATAAKIPWKNILTSYPFFVIIIANIGPTWGFISVSMYTPTYLNDVFGYTLEETGYFIGISSVLKACATYFIGWFSDFLVGSKIMTITSIRKLFTFFGSIVAGASLLVIPFSEYNLIASLLSIGLNIIISSFFLIGASASIVDISPNYCGILQGISNAFSFSMGTLCSLTTNYIAQYNDTYSLWKQVFLISALMNIITGGIFILFGSSEVQRWNCNELKIKIDEYKKIRTEEV